jgi:uncharacterized protein (TIGR00661 family)
MGKGEDLGSFLFLFWLGDFKLKTIAYYISDYGYGHASRSIAIIRKLLSRSDVRIIVCHSFALSFMRESLNSDRVSYREVKTDIGYFLQVNSIHPDKVKMLNEYKSFVANWEHSVNRELEFLKSNHVNLVVSDISPLPFEAAESLGIPSVGISNFTWYTAYQGLIDDLELNTYKKAYQKMSAFYSLAGSQEKWDISSNSYGFFSREVDVREVARIRQLVNPSGDQKVIFLGLGMKIDAGSLEQFPIWDSPNCVFLVSSNVHVNKDNVYQIPAEYLESQNYIAASNLVISKAGWGMIGEALSARVPLLILDRPSMKEDQNTIQYLKERNLCETIDWEDFKDYQLNPNHFTTHLSAEIQFDRNEAERIANDLIALMNSSID